MTRRDFGHIRKRNGKYIASFLHPITGKRVSKTWATNREANAFLDQILEEIEGGKIPPSRGTRLRGYRGSYDFVNVVTAWEATCVRKPSVIRTDESLLRIHLLPYWGRWDVRTITKHDVHAWTLTVLPADKPGARHHAFSLLRQILTFAYHMDMIDKLPISPETVKYVSANRRGNRHEPRALSDSDIEAILASGALCREARALFLFLLATGLRIGEARELRWGDIDTEAHTITVARAVTGDGARLHIDTPKTRASVRVLPYGSQVEEILASMVPRPPEALVFPSVTNPSKHQPSTFLTKALARACRQAGITHVSAHDLRHTFATRATQAGSLPSVQQYLGHASIAMSAHYTHPQLDTLRALGSAVAESIPAPQEASPAVGAPLPISGGDNGDITHTAGELDVDQLTGEELDAYMFA